MDDAGISLIQTPAKHCVQYATVHFRAVGPSAPNPIADFGPDERLDADLKHAIGVKDAVRTMAKLKSSAEAHMIATETSSDRAKACFRDPNVCYAA